MIFLNSKLNTKIIANNLEQKGQLERNIFSIDAEPNCQYVRIIACFAKAFNKEYF